MITSVEFKSAVETVLPTNHIFVADVSGSMYNSLPKIRQHLKQNLAMMVKPMDTISILYFASKGQCGPVFVGEKVHGVEDLSNINEAIDRYLRPTGCTGFVEPLNLACDVANELVAKNGNLNNLIFMTDGYDNCWRESEILSACARLPESFHNIMFLEYGWYCNRELLEKMSEATNALHTFSENYDQYETTFEQALAQQTAKRIEISVPTADHVVYMDGLNLNVVNVANGVALVPENVAHVWALNGNDEIVDGMDDITKYVAMYYAVHRMNPDLAWNVLKVLGDVRLARMYTNCFSKQDYSNMKAAVLECIVDETKRFSEGFDLNVVPDENATTLVDVLTSLIKHGAELDLKSPFFSYNRGGRKAVQKADATVADLSAEMTDAASTEDMLAIAQKMVDHVEWNPEFKSTQETVPMSNIVYNGSRPNINVATQMEGVIAVPESVQAKFNVPAEVASKIHRNYTIVRDGIVNMKQLPVLVPAVALVDMNDVKYSVLGMVGDKASLVVDLTTTPLVNRAMVKGLSGVKFCEDYVRLQRMKALQKVYKAKREELVGKVNAVGLASLYGAEAASYLSERGIRDYGFSPKTTLAESTDVYMGRELNVKVKGMSSLPALSAVQKKVDGNKKLNVADAAIWDAMTHLKAALEGMSTDEAVEYITVATTTLIESVRELEKSLSVTMYGIIVAKRWFEDVEFENPTLDVVVDGITHNVTIDLAEKEFKV